MGAQQSPDKSSSHNLNAAHGKKTPQPEDQKKALTEVKRQTRRHNQNIATSLEYNQAMSASADGKSLSEARGSESGSHQVQKQGQALRTPHPADQAHPLQDVLRDAAVVAGVQQDAHMASEHRSVGHNIASN